MRSERHRKGRHALCVRVVSKAPRGECMVRGAHIFIRAVGGSGTGRDVRRASEGALILCSRMAMGHVAT